MRFDSASYSRNGSTRGWSESFQTVENVTAAEIMALNVPSQGEPYLEFFMATVPFAPFKVRIHIPSFVGAMIPKATPVAPPAPRSPKDMVLYPWNKTTDLDRLELRRRTP